MEDGNYGLWKNNYGLWIMEDAPQIEFMKLTENVLICKDITYS